MDLESAKKARAEWGLNCGPAALCAILDKTPIEIRPYLLDFERKRYTNPALMAAILRALRVPFKRAYERLGCVEGMIDWTVPACGLVRVQWGGPWTRPGVPVAARYRHTHWVAARASLIFDVNALGVGDPAGWISYGTWSETLVPWLIRNTQPGASGEWWPTHIWELDITNGR